MAEKLDYSVFVDNAMRGAVRDILRQVSKSGLPGENHFFISYRTDFSGVKISDSLRNRYPEEITIVLQHQFWDLRVEDDKFSVSLSFNNIPEVLVVPFAALTGFSDPSTKFGLQFHEVKAPAPILQPEVAVFQTEESSPQEEKESAKIITLDAFRKK